MRIQPPASTVVLLALAALNPVACDCEEEPIASFECSFEVSPEEILFPATAVGDRTERTFRVSNTGRGVTLDQLAVTFESVNGRHYEAAIPEGTRVTVGDTSTFSVAFEPLIEGDLASQFVVSHPNVGNSQCPSISIAVRGTGFEELEVDGGPSDGGPSDAGPFDGGQADGGVVDAPDGGVELPANGEWFAYGALEEARSGFAAVQLRDGSGDILVVGGYGEEGGALDSVERLNPTTGVSRVVARMVVPRADPAVATLADGKVVIMGGRSAVVDGFALRTVEIFDPIQGDTLVCADTAANGCQPDRGPLIDGRIGAHAMVTSGGQVLVLLGRTLNESGDEIPAPDGEVITLSPLGSAPLGQESTLGARVGAAEVRDAATGDLLLVGGRSGSDAVLGDVVRISASLRTATVVASLAFPRAFASAALLSDGTAMIAGGVSGTGVGVVDVELVRSAFTDAALEAADLQVSPRVGGSLLALEGDFVLWAGGVSRRIDNLPIAESLVPSSGADLIVPLGISSFLRVSTDNDLAQGRIEHQALVLGPEHRVAVFVGGSNTAPRRTPHPHVERFLLEQNRFATFGLMGPGTALEAGLVSGSGAALVSVGGVDPHTGRTSGAVRAFDATNGIFVEAGELREPRRDHTVTRFSVTDDQALLVAGGRDENGTVLSSLSIVDPVNLVDRPLPVSLRTARADHTATRLADGNPIADGAVLLCGGVGQGGEALDSCEVVVPPANPLDPTTFDDESEVTVVPVVGRLSTGRVAHSATLLETGEVVLIGGGDPSVDLVAADVFVPSAGQPFVRPSLGAPVQARRGHAAVFLGSGRILVVGGEAANGVVGPTRTAEVYIHASESFLALPEMEEERAAPGAFLLGDGNVLITGGARNNGTPGVPTRSNTSSELFVVAGDGTGTFEELPDVPLSYGRSDVLFLDVFGRAIVAGGTHRDGVIASGSERRTPISFVDFLQEPGDAFGP